MFDVALVGGFVVTPNEEALLDLGITDGKIAAIANPGELGEAKKTVDATGLTLVPGGIDPHVHCDLAIDHEGHDLAVSFGPDVVGTAALIGGTTMLIDFVWKDQDESIRSGIDRVRERWDSVSPIDYSFHVVLRGRLDRATVAQIPETIDAGFPSFKVFTTNVFPSAPVGGVPLMIDFGSLQEVLETTRDNGGIVAIHSEDDDIVQHMYRRLLEEDRMEYTNMHLVHNSLSEDLSFRRVIRLAGQVGNAPIYFMHVSAASGVDAIAEARRDDQPVFAETLHQYALHTRHDYEEHDGMKYHTYPSLKEHEDAARLWSGIADGSISAFATDEQSTSYQVKTQGNRVDDVVGGNAGIEPRMSLLYTEFDKRGLGLRAFVNATSTNVAKIMGMYPQKGALAVGSDADIVAFRTGLDKTITKDELHESDYTPWEGWQVTAWPAMTLLRGAVVAEEGSFVGDPTGGQLVPRSISPEVAKGRRFV
ncbi:MAG: Dihydropyrimidinase [Nocardioides sp.]|jgi:dihydropyrimidinase|nr:Dihydropyrimidinase [Nocardioides sp.]